VHRWDEDFKKKPAYDAILEAYSGASSSSSSASPATNISTTASTSIVPAESSTISNIATSVTIAESTGFPDRSTMESLPSATALALEATDDAECEVVYMY
jgi:hypothetical protein